MAPPPSIPTSFLPHPSLATRRSSTNSIVDVLAYLAFVIAGAIFVLAIGVFLYGQVLAKTKTDKDVALAKANASVSDLVTTTVPGFTRLHNRLDAAASLIGSHIAFSGFFPALEEIMPSTIRFSSIHLSFDSKGVPTFDASGIAKNFNSLAVASAAFATDSRLKGALFSDIKLNSKDGSVGFALTATLDPKVIVFTP